jgi:cytochrome c oxidase subunit II
MSIAPPSERLWWKQPIPRVEVIWMAIAFLWGLVMFFMMIYWHAVGRQNLANVTYRTTPEVFAASTRFARRPDSRSCTRRQGAMST